MRTMSENEREENGLKLLKWQDEKLEGSLFVNWRPFRHPQLGEVEIGGWEPKMGRQNPPVSLLEEECRKNAEFTLTRASISPRLVIEKVTVESLFAGPAGLGAAGAACDGGHAGCNGIYKVEAVVKNEGYLPTHVTFHALRMRQGTPVKVALLGVQEEDKCCGSDAARAACDGDKGGAGNDVCCPAAIISGKVEQEIGHLGGRVGGGDVKCKLTWVVRAKAGTRLAIEAKTARAGKAKAEVVLE